MGVPLSVGGIMSAVRDCGGSTPLITFCWMRCIARANCSRVSLPICRVSARALQGNNTHNPSKVTSCWTEQDRYAYAVYVERWRKPLQHVPNMCKDILRESRVHKDLLYFLSTDKTIKVGICLQEDVVIAATLCHGNHPVQRMLREKMQVLWLSVCLIRYQLSSDTCWWLRAAR